VFIVQFTVRSLFIHCSFTVHPLFLHCSFTVFAVFVLSTTTVVLLPVHVKLIGVSFLFWEGRQRVDRGKEVLMGLLGEPEKRPPVQEKEVEEEEEEVEEEEVEVEVEVDGMDVDSSGSGPSFEYGGANE
jgi:hypothetical protein